MTLKISHLAGIGGSAFVYYAKKISNQILNQVRPSSPTSRPPKDSSETVIIKCFKYENDFLRERLAILELKEHGPEALKFLETREGRYIVYPVYQRISLVYKCPLYGVKVLELKDFFYLLELLEKIHELGIIHCDIRPENIVYIELDKRVNKGRPMFIDYAFHRKVDQGEAVYRGTRETASNRLMRELAANEDAIVKVTIRDDLESLYKCFQLYYRGLNTHIGEDDWNGRLKMWLTDPFLLLYEHKTDDEFRNALKLLFSTELK